ncbi:MAG: cation:proton antiporter [Deferribacterales bacterium]
MTHKEIGSLFLALFLILALSKLIGELTRKYFKSGLLGEILTGIIFGPTLLGTFSPTIYSELINNNTFKTFLNFFNNIAVVMLLLIAGMESNIKSLLKQKVILLAAPLKLVVALIFTIITFGFFYNINYLNYNSYIFLISLGFALSITALPVLVRLLSELNLYRTDFGMSLVGTAMLIDIVVWLLFSVVLVFDGRNITTNGIVSIITKIILIILLIIFIITVMRIIVDRSLPFIQSRFSWPDGIIAFILSISFLFAGLSELLGTHAIVGAFLTGMIISDSSHFKEKVQGKIESIVNAFFAPLYFGSLGLQLNFLENVDIKITALFLLLGFLISAISGFVSYKKFNNTTRESLAFGFCLNTQGATDIIFFTVVFSLGIINSIVYTSYVLYVMLVIIITPFLLRKLLAVKYHYKFYSYINNDLFIPEIKAKDSNEAIQKICEIIAQNSGLDYNLISSKVIEREDLMPTGIGNGVAIPHARIPGLEKPIIAVAISELGIDFGSRDGDMTHLIFLILTPEENPTIQLEILADIAKTFKFFEPHTIIGIKNMNQFISFMRNELNIS